MKNRFSAFFLCAGLSLLFPGPSSAQWEQTNGPERCQITTLAVSGPDLFAGTSRHGVFKSTDNGMSWMAVNSGLPLGRDIDFLAVEWTRLFAGTGSKIYRSADGGTNWAAFGPDLPSDEGTSCFEVSDGRLLAGTKGGRIYLSTYGGTGWTVTRLRSSSAVFSLVSAGTQFLVISEGDIVVTCFYKSGSKLYAGTGGSVKSNNRAAVTNSVYSSFDGGLTWKSEKARFSSSVDCLAVIGTNLFVGTERGLYLCADLGDCPAPSKLKLSRAISVTSLEAIGTDLLVGTGNGVFLVKNDGKNWTAVDTGMRKKIAITCLARTEAHLFAGTHDHGVWRLSLSDLSRK